MVKDPLPGEYFIGMIVSAEPLIVYDGAYSLKVQLSKKD